MVNINCSMFSLWRITKFAFQDMGRNLGLSIMTVFILVLMLLSVNVLWSVDVVTSEAIRLVKNQINASIFFTAEAKDADIDAIKKYVVSFPEIVESSLQTRDQVLQSFADRYQTRKEVTDALAELGSNPFGPTLIIKTKEPGDYKKILDSLNTPEYNKIIEGKSFDEHQADVVRIQDITNSVERMGLGLSALFAIIAFLIIFNTIRVAIYTQRMEIGIKRLVGASNWFIRGPYLVESLVFTVFSVFFTLAVIYISLHWVDPYFRILFASEFSLTRYYNSHILMLIGYQALAVLLLTVISSTLAMRRQLKI